MSTKTTPAPGDMPCPDPSAHPEHSKLPEAASTAALLATHSDRNGSQRENPLDSNGKLSSSSAAHSLKHARPQDLPSFPSRGGESSAAGTAALLAKDYKGREMHRPEASAAGSKAAYLAAKDGGKLNLWQPSPTSAGNSAATLAMRNKTLSPEIDRGYTDAGRNNSMLAATQSIRQSNRQRAGSMPTSTPGLYPDSQNSKKNAHNAATVSHRASTRMAPDGWSSEANQAARVKNLHMQPEMFGDHPPVEPELEEQRHNAALRASAVSMAKQMMEYQNRAAAASETSSVQGSAGAGTAHRRNQSTTSQADVKDEAIKYLGLQEAARKLAQERLAKVDKEMEQGRYREYYGYPDSRKSRLSVRGRGRKRASSEGGNLSDSDDEVQARRIRSQMSQLNRGINTVDDSQRNADRARLMAAAEKRVHAQMSTMDEKVFQDTGKPTQAMMDEWETKARAKAEQNRAERESHPGQTHIGGGKYMAQSEIEAIAAARLKPTFDELNDTAEKKRARDQEMMAERDRRETEKMNEKMRDQQTKAEFKRIRDQDKAAARKEKEERKARERAEKEEAKARKSEIKRKSREQKRDTVAAVAGGAALAEVAEKVKEPEEAKTSNEEARDSVESSALPRESTESAEEPRGRSTSPVEPRKSTDSPIGPREPAHEVVAAEPTRETSGETPREVPREVVSEAPQEEKKDKAGKQGMLGRITSKLKRRSDEGKRSEEPAKAVDEPGRDLREAEEKRMADMNEGDKNDGTASAAAVAMLGTGIPAAGGVQEEQAPRGRDFAVRDEPPRDAEASESTRGGQAPAATAASVAALGPVVAAGAMENDKAKSQDEEDDSSSLTSLSTNNDVSDDDRDLHGVTSAAEHTGDYNFAMASPGVEKRPDLMRHISTIESSSSSEPDESPELTESDEEGHHGPLEPRPTMVEQSWEPAPALKTEDVSPRNAPLMVESGSAFVPEDKLDTPESPVSPLAPEDEVYTHGNIVIVNKNNRPAVYEPTRVVESSSSPTETPAPAPVVATVPPIEGEAITPPTTTQEKGKEPVKEKEKDKEDRGIRGFFRKMRNKSKPDNKLTKSRRSSADDVSEKSFQGGAKLAETEGKEVTSPVATERRGTDGPIGDSQHISGIGGDPHAVDASTASTAQSTEVQSQHVGADGPIGDDQHVSGIGGDPRAASPSSFERHNEPTKDADDVSSSGADEEDVSRGRTGRLVKGLGLRKDKGKGKVQTDEIERTKSVTSNGDEEQFEEARDHFDETLAPPPAFAGQAKSESPARETRFQEQL